MAPGRETGGLLGAVVGALLVAFVVVAGAASYYALQPVALPMGLLAAEPEAPLGARPVRWCVEALSTIRGWPIDEAQRQRLAAVMLLAARRVGWLAVWGPPAAMIVLGALLEGLWAREGIRVSLGYSSAALFSFGKLALGLSALALLGYVFVPFVADPVAWIGSAALLAALGAHGAARSLPVHL